MSLEVWLLFVLVSVAPVISPGPGVLFAITNALRFGARTTILVGVVNAAGIAALALVVGYGLGAVMSASAIAFTALKIAGAAYLIWLGVKIWRDRSAFLVEADATAEKPPMRKLCVHALAISLTNPKAAVALAALFPAFLDPTTAAGPQIVILSLTYGGLCALNHVVIGVAGGRIRSFLCAPNRARIIRRVAGGTFVGFGLAMAASGRP
ncbi:MAG: LysE family translocator [Pseudomonadota bacterium]